MNRIKKLEQLVKKYQKLSLTDDLTGLWNRRKLLRDLERYSNLKKRFRIPFFICMIDLDGFKKINDVKGHCAGNLLLKKVAKVLCNSVRNYDDVYRLYGDEFIIIFSYNNNPDMLKERLRQNLIKNKIQASIGICELGKHCLKEVDKLMYIDKRRKNK